MLWGISLFSDPVSCSPQPCYHSTCQPARPCYDIKKAHTPCLTSTYTRPPAVNPPSFSILHSPVFRGRIRTGSLQQATYKQLRLPRWHLFQLALLPPRLLLERDDCLGRTTINPLASTQEDIPQRGTRCTNSTAPPQPAVFTSHLLLGQYPPTHIRTSLPPRAVCLRPRHPRYR